MNSRYPIFLPSLFGLTGGLFSYIVAGYLVPTFAQHAQLAIGLCLLCSFTGLSLTLYRRHGRPNLHLLTLIDPLKFQKLHTILGNVLDFDTVDGRRMWLYRTRHPVVMLTGCTASDNSTSDIQPDGNLYNYIKFEGSKNQFINNLLTTLLCEAWFDEGKEYLQSLLTGIREESGLETQQLIDDLLPVIDALAPAPTRIVRFSNIFSAPAKLLYNTPQLWLYLAAIPLSVLLILTGGPMISDAWAQVAPECPPDRTCILIADFSETAQENVVENLDAQPLTDAIVADVKAVVRMAGDGRFTIKRIAAVQDDAEAQTLAREQKALLTIWGERVKTGNENPPRLTIKFALADLLGAGGSTDVRGFRVEPQRYQPIDGAIACRNCLYPAPDQDISLQAQIIAYTAIGLLHYVQGRPEDARLDFAAALWCAGQEVGDQLVMAEDILCTPATGQMNDPTNYGLLYYYLGRALQFRGDYASALAHLEQADKLNPHDPAVLVGMASIYQQWLADPQAPQAVALFDDALDRIAQLMNQVRENERADLEYLQGVIHELMAEFELAQERYAVAVQGYSENSIAHISAYHGLVTLARMQAINGEIEEAETTLIQAVQLSEDAPWAYLAFARLHQDDAPRMARNRLNMALQRSPNTGYVHLVRADLYTTWGAYDEAEEAYTRALKIRKSSGWVYDRMGDFFWHHREDYEAAFQHYQSAVERRPCDPWTHERMARAVGKRGDHPAAVGYYQSALNLIHPDTAQKHIDRLEMGLQIAIDNAGGEMDDLRLLVCSGFLADE